MKKAKFAGLCRKYSADKIITMYMMNKIYLTNKQLDHVIANGSHHGGCLCK